MTEEYAFPSPQSGDEMHGDDGRVWYQYPPILGMTLRDWFAGKALSGLITQNMTNHEFQLLGVDSYRAADLMLAERNRLQEADKEGS